MSTGAEAGERDAGRVEVETGGVGEDVEDCGYAVFDSGWEGVRGCESVAYAYEDAWTGGMRGQ